MAPPSVTAVKVENVEFPATVKAPGSDKSFFLGGAGERGLQIQDKFVKFTAIGVYLQDDDAVTCLAPKWKGKTAEELTDSVEFFRDIVTGNVRKFQFLILVVVFVSSFLNMFENSDVGSVYVSESFVRIALNLGILVIISFPNDLI